MRRRRRSDAHTFLFFPFFALSDAFLLCRRPKTERAAAAAATVRLPRELGHDRTHVERMTLLILHQVGVQWEFIFLLRCESFSLSNRARATMKTSLRRIKV